MLIYVPLASMDQQNSLKILKDILKLPKKSTNDSDQQFSDWTK